MARNSKIIIFFLAGIVALAPIFVAPAFSQTSGELETELEQIQTQQINLICHSVPSHGIREITQNVILNLLAPPWRRIRNPETLKFKKFKGLYRGLHKGL